MNKLLALSCLFFLIISLPLHVNAQMFSVGDSEARPEARLNNYSTVGVGWEFADFDFTGEGVAPRDRADFEDSIIRFRFENPGLRLTAGLGGALTGMSDRSYVNVNALLYNDFSLIRTPRFVLGVPIQISTDLKSVALTESNNSFRQSSVVFGTGASIRYKINQRVGTSLRVTPHYGFSVSQETFFGGRGGQLFTTTASARLYFDDVIGSNSLAIGYDFDYRDYDIEGGTNDYEFLSHSFTVGIAF